MSEYTKSSRRASLPTPVVTFGCPECGSKVRTRQRKRDGKTFLGCSAYPRCDWTGDCDSRLEALAKVVAELQADRTVVAGRKIRNLLAWCHPDKHPSGTIDAHELAVRLTELHDTARSA